MAQRDSELVNELLGTGKGAPLEAVAKRVGAGTSTLGLWKREAAKDPEGFRLSDLYRERVKAYLEGRGRELFEAAEQLEEIAALLREQGTRISAPDAGAVEKARSLANAGRALGGKGQGKKGKKKPA